MTFRDGPRQDRGSPLTWATVGAVAVALLVAVVMLLADKREAMSRTGQYGAARSEFDELAAPVMGVLTAPVRFLANASTDVRGYFFAVSENRRLRERLKEMERWRDAAVALKNVNERYETLLKLHTEPAIPMISARIVADARGPFSNARLADAGTEDGVVNGQPVLSEHGVVGRIVGAAPHASRVLLLTDADSRTPVLVDRTNARAILTGDGGANPRLEYLRGGDVIKAGDVLLTSGDGGVYPRGLAVGVAAQDLRGQWRARLYADRQALDFVRILTYVDFGRLAKEATLAASAPPPLDPTETAQLQAALAARTSPPPGTAPPPATAPAPPTSTAAGASTSAAKVDKPAAASAARAASKTPSPRVVTPGAATPGATPGPAVKRRPKTAVAATGGAPSQPPTASSPRGEDDPAEPKAKPRRAASSTAAAAAAARRSEAPAGETGEERARRLRLRALTQDATRPKTTMRPIPDPQDDR